MNQSGDLLLFATESNPYPCVATMAFNEHNRSSLIHSSDPQVRPGWMPFGWGHGRIDSGLPNPVDAVGLAAAAPAVEGVKLTLELPQEVVRGNYVVATVTVENHGERPCRVSEAMSLAEGGLRIRMELPDGSLADLRDVVSACGLGSWLELEPGASRVGVQQLFYTSRGFTFERTGRYRLRAEVDVADPPGSVARSGWVDLLVRPAATSAERARERLGMDPEVGLSLALGDVGAGGGVAEKLSAILDQHGFSDLGRACGLTLANAHSRDLRDLRAGKVVRPADPDAADRALRLAMREASASHLACLVSSVATPGGSGEPVVERLRAALDSADDDSYEAADIAGARAILPDPWD